ncbi:MAG: hypothetical protein MZU97_10990 [Bacillus subtilis]|nr:hypothetical protein [Bacillus subtilis]
MLDKAKLVAKNNQHKGITEKDFKEALLRTYFGVSNPVQNPIPSKKVTTGHECGHMLNGLIMHRMGSEKSKALEYNFSSRLYDP